MKTNQLNKSQFKFKFIHSVMLLIRDYFQFILLRFVDMYSMFHTIKKENDYNLQWKINQDFYRIDLHIRTKVHSCNGCNKDKRRREFHTRNNKKIYTLVSAPRCPDVLMSDILHFFMLDGIKMKIFYLVPHTLVAHHWSSTQTLFHLIASWQIACRIEWMNKSNSVCVCVHQHRKYFPNNDLYSFWCVFRIASNSMIVMQTHTHI